jgi:hypothetical protein
MLWFLGGIGVLNLAGLLFLASRQKNIDVDARLREEFAATRRESAESSKD